MPATMQPPSPGRRRFLAGAAAFIPTAYLYGCAGGIRPGVSPFTLGVASGEPRPDRVVLWTRLAPEPLAGGGLSSDPVEVAWTLAEDESFSRVVQRGSVRAVAEDAHSVHVEVAGLQPGRPYWYRFVAAGEASPTGRTRTAPAAQAATPVRIALASCQQYEHGYYAAHRHMAAEELDAVLFVGDYIYETSWGRDRIRNHGTKETFTLADYRNRYALYKSDADLQSCHAAHPWIVTWDDHEVSNDYANDRGEKLSGAEFLRRRAAAYKAYWEHMPLPPAMRPGGPDMTLYRSFDFGRMARFAVLDDRQYRSHQPCPRPGFAGGGGTHDEAACTGRLDPALTMLGAAQDRWLRETIDGAAANWTVIVQQTRVTQVDMARGPARRFWTDGWDGYVAARKRLLDYLAQRRPRNSLVLGGDIHSTLVSDLKLDFDDARAAAVAGEIVGTSITSQGPSNEANFQRLLRENPHVHYGNGATRGYLRVAFEGKATTAELRGLADVKDRGSAISTIARFAAEDGRPGVQKA